MVYMATFGGSLRLPEGLDPTFWVPIDPAEREEGERNVYKPISSVNGTAQWVSIRKRIRLREWEVSRDR